MIQISLSTPAFYGMKTFKLFLLLFSLNSSTLPLFQHPLYTWGSFPPHSSNKYRRESGMCKAIQNTGHQVQRLYQQSHSPDAVAHSQQQLEPIARLLFRKQFPEGQQIHKVFSNYFPKPLPTSRFDSKGQSRSLAGASGQRCRGCNRGCC